MDREGGGIPPWLIAGLVCFVLLIGALAYYAGRFKRDGQAPPAAEIELPQPGAPSPDLEEAVPTPGEVPPTVTPSAAVLIEKTSRTPSGVLLEKSSQVVVPVAPERIATPPRTVIEIPPSPRPSPTPTVPELEQLPPEEPEPAVTPELPPSSPPPPPPTPEPPAFPPTPGVSAGNGPAAFAP